MLVWQHLKPFETCQFKIEMLAGGATPQDKKYSVAFGLRLILLHKKLRQDENPKVHDAEIWHELSHSQIGAGTGEDLVFFCYLFERLYGGYDTLEELQEKRISAQALDPPPNETETTSKPAYLDAWDFDEAALRGCRESLNFTSASCKITNRDLYKLTDADYCQSTTAVSTGTGGPTFVIQSLLYVMGARKTKYFICDNPGNREALYKIIQGMAERMGFNSEYTKKVVRAVRTSVTDDSNVNEQYVGDAFHGPFMVSVLAAINGDKIDNRRDLSFIVVDKLIAWTYKYLRPPDLETKEPPPLTNAVSVDLQWRHCMVSASFV